LGDNISKWLQPLSTWLLLQPHHRQTKLVLVVANLGRKKLHPKIYVTAIATNVSAVFEIVDMLIAKPTLLK
jgi:hypothetical protein